MTRGELSLLRESDDEPPKALMSGWFSAVLSLDILVMMFLYERNKESFYEADFLLLG